MIPFGYSVSLPKPLLFRFCIDPSRVFLCICFAFALHLLAAVFNSVQPRGKATAAPRLRRCRFAFAQLVACRCISQQYLEFSIVLMCYDSVTVVPSSDPKDLLGKSFSCAVQEHEIIRGKHKVGGCQCQTAKFPFTFMSSQ